MTAAARTAAAGPSRPRWTEVALAAAAYLAITIAISWRVWRHPSVVLIGGYGDPMGYVHSFWWQANVHWQLFGTTHINGWGAPLGFLQDYAFFLPQQLVLIPGTLMTTVLGPVVAYNLLVLVALVLSGAAMYALARFLGAVIPVAGWSGLVFIIFPWHVVQTDHVGIASVWPLPLIALAGLMWWLRPTLPRGLAVGAVLAVQLLTDPYVGFSAMVLTAVIVVLGTTRAWRAGRRRSGVSALWHGVVGTAWGPVLLYGYLLYDSKTVSSPLLTTRESMKVQVVKDYAARWPEFVLPNKLNPALGRFVAHWYVLPLHRSNLGENPLFLGYLTIAMAIVFLVVAWRRRGTLPSIERYGLRLGVSSAVAGLVMALAQPIAVGGLQIPSIGLLIFRVAPFWRVYSRFVVLVMLGLLVLAALGMNRIVVRYRARWQWVLVGVACALSAAELWTPVPTWDLTTINRQYAALRSVDPGGLLAEYPLAASDSWRSEQSLYGQTIHGHPLVTGGPIGDTSDLLRRSVSSMVGPLTPRMLAFAGVHLVALTDPRIAPPPGLTPVPAASSSGLAVYRVTARPTDGLALVSTDRSRARWRDGTPCLTPVATCPARFGEPVWHVHSRIVKITLWVNKPGAYSVAFRAQSGHGSRRMSFQGSSVVPTMGVVRVDPSTLSFIVRLSAGLTPLTVTFASVSPHHRATAETDILMSNWLMTRL